MVDCPSNDTDPFLETDTQVELDGLVEKSAPAGERCPVEEYIEGDDGMPLCTDSKDWEDNVLYGMGQEREVIRGEL